MTPEEGRRFLERDFTPRSLPKPDERTHRILRGTMSKTYRPDELMPLGQEFLIAWRAYNGGTGTMAECTRTIKALARLAGL